MSDTETLYDQIIRKLQNNKVVVVILVVFAVILGVAQFQGALSGIIGAVRTQKIEVQASIRPFDVMGGAIAPRKDLPLLENAVNRIDKIATSLAGEIVSEVGVNPTALDATLRLDGGTLISSQPLRAFVLVLASPMSQVGRIPKDFGDATGLDVLPLFGDPQGTNSDDKSVDAELVPQHGYFNREPLKIFKRDQGFSFEPSQDQRTRVIRFTPHKPQVMLVFDTAEPSLENAKASLEFMLRSELKRSSSALELSPLTQAELDAQKEKIQHMGPGIMKSQLADKYNVDYIVEAKVLSE